MGPPRRGFLPERTNITRMRVDFFHYAMIIENKLIEYKIFQSRHETQIGRDPSGEQIGLW
jgi:hypothetical protein